MADMYICDRCGKPTPNYSKCICGPVCGSDGYSICDDCRKQRARECAWENVQWHQEAITCPWCGYVDTDSWEFDDEYDDKYECLRCGKPFVLEKLVEVTYTSRRRIEDMPEGWDGE